MVWRDQPRAPLWDMRTLCDMRMSGLLWRYFSALLPWCMIWGRGWVMLKTKPRRQSHQRVESGHSLWSEDEGMIVEIPMNQVDIPSVPNPALSQRCGLAADQCGGESDGARARSRWRINSGHSLRYEDERMVVELPSGGDREGSWHRRGQLQASRYMITQCAQAEKGRVIAERACKLERISFQDLPYHPGLGADRHKGGIVGAKGKTVQAR
ncbi:hypothetical protein K504DRAFT_455502 [Pleomassaria siparia CBS 279.74]|uniref:Uncharacterized protein n=1 Tax=Pleomassaria siparia CBS 279.74 TaxID=1314801 RepID=A0A6G1KAP6_9PLEO|nr:hypothetical protein K504DRAFT_455502 [Pleomassaria siparia CBS 279.74]